MLQRQEAIHGFLPTVTFFRPQSGPELAQMASRGAFRRTRVVCCGILSRAPKGVVWD
jgi:hypothetical protein